MKTRLLTWTTAITLLAVLAIPVRLAAQKQHTRYNAIDLGTFGGPNSYVNGFPSEPPFGSGAQVLNNQGVVAGSADTTTPDPFPTACFNPDCFVSHTFRWQNGILTDLGTLAAGWSSAALWISDTGQIVGLSENGVIDPLIGFPEVRGVLWKDGHIVNLGTLGGNESVAGAVNNGGQVVGAAANTILDPFSAFGWGTQTRAFLWQKGVMQDLGTLGGPDAFPNAVNDRGQIAGASYTNSTPNPVTGIPTQDPFLWENGKMIDLGTLGGHVGVATAINNHGQIVGQSNLAGDLSWHPFLWDRGVLTDLGTFYQGPPQFASQNQFGTANWINDAGEIVGWATSQFQSSVFIWKDGPIANAGTVAGDTCAGANSVNSRGQAVGGSGPCGVAEVHAFLWEHGGPLIDLNTLIAPGSGVRLLDALTINDRGEIAAEGLLPNGNMHVFLLVPCGDGDTACANSAPTAPGVAQPRTAAPPPNPALRGRSMLDRLRGRQFPGRRSLTPASGPTR